MLTRLKWKAPFIALTALLAVTAPGSLAADQKASDISIESESQPGALETASVDDYELDDAAFNKKLLIKVTYPTVGGHYPIIVFSHGAGGSKDAYGPLVDYWSSHGYVVIQPSHADSIKLRHRNGEKVESLLRPSDLSNGWIERVQDIKLVMDSLGKIEQENRVLKDKWDKSKIGIGGHSFGAMTTEILCGTTISDPTIDQNSIHDKRPKAALLLSPSGEQEHPPIKADAWSQMKLPTMTITGTFDKGMLGQDPSWRREPYLYAPAGSKYLVFINNGNHMIFGGDPSASAKLKSIFGSDKPTLNNLTDHQPSPKDYETMFHEVQLASEVFWDAYLKNDKSAKAMLDGDALAKASEGIAEVKHR